MFIQAKQGIKSLLSKTAKCFQITKLERNLKEFANNER